MTDDDRSAGSSLFNSAGGLAGSVLRLFGVRASFALLELADARDALLRMLLLGAVALAAALLGLVCLSALVVVLFWDALGWRILLILAIVYAALSALLMQRAMRIVAEGQLGLPVTMAELDKDRAAIFGDAAGEGEAL
jgi:uncharacterized membrane protein YqjE